MRRSRWRDPRIWLGIAITAVTLWLALRGIDLAVLARDLSRADLPLVIGLSVPSYVLLLWLRALRWRHLTNAIAPLPLGSLYRATAVGFLANNVFPLRLGELVRAWALARDQHLGVAPVVGTIVLERVIDGIVVVVLAMVIFGVRGSRSGDTLAVGIPLLFGALLPLGAVLLMRFRPEGPRDWPDRRRAGCCRHGRGSRSRTSSGACPRAWDRCTGDGISGGSSSTPR